MLGPNQMSRKKEAAKSAAPPPEQEQALPLPENVRGDFDRAAAKDYVARQESEHAYLRVELSAFEGPLDLLLHLIRKHALEILDIPVSFITEKFLQVLDQMKAADIDIAAEFLVMAATLAHIKSKMLLPPDQAAEAEDQEELDPRSELVRRLLEYQKYKQAAEALMGRGVLFRDVFPRGRASVSHSVDENLRVDITAMDLIGALEEILRRAKVPISHDVVFERMSVGARINEMLELCHQRDSFTFETALLHLFSGVPDRARVIVTLLAMLEMARLKLVRVNQPAEGGAIYVTPIKENLQGVDAESVGRDYA